MTRYVHSTHPPVRRPLSRAHTRLHSVKPAARACPQVPTIAKRVEVTSSPETAQTVLVETLVTEELHVGEFAKHRVHLETDYMPRKTWWSFAQVPASTCLQSWRRQCCRC